MHHAPVGAPEERWLIDAEQCGRPRPVCRPFALDWPVDGGADPIEVSHARIDLKKVSAWWPLKAQGIDVNYVTNLRPDPAEAEPE